MLVFSKKAALRLASAVAVLLIILIIVLCVTQYGSKKLNFEAVFYYVCHNSPEDSASVASISGLVHNYGGAGYIVTCGGKNLVTVACYYSETDAVTVCNSLNAKGLKCSVVEVKVKDKRLNGGAAKNSAKYEGNLNTLLSLSKICYGLANSLDKYEIGQSGAKSLLSDVESGIDALINSNAANCFTGELNNLKAECGDVSYGYIFSYDVRRLQIAICDSIANVNIY